MSRFACSRPTRIFRRQRARPLVNQVATDTGTQTAPSRARLKNVARRSVWRRRPFAHAAPHPRPMCASSGSGEARPHAQRVGRARPGSDACLSWPLHGARGREAQRQRSHRRVRAGNSAPPAGNKKRNLPRPPCAYARRVAPAGPTIKQLMEPLTPSPRFSHVQFVSPRGRVPETRPGTPLVRSVPMAPQSGGPEVPQCQ